MASAAIDRIIGEYVIGLCKRLQMCLANNQAAECFRGGDSFKRKWKMNSNCLSSFIWVGKYKSSMSLLFWRPWSHIQDFQDFIRRISGMFRHASFPKCSIFEMLRFPKIIYEGFARNAGPFTLACSLLAAFSNFFAEICPGSLVPGCSFDVTCFIIHGGFGGGCCQFWCPKRVRPLWHLRGPSSDPGGLRSTGRESLGSRLGSLSILGSFWDRIL